MAVPAGYIAVRSWDTSIGDDEGWLETGVGATDGDLPLSSGRYGELAPPHKKYYGRLGSVVAKVERDYGGINSSGGPQVSGRADHSDLVVVRAADKVSPYLFQYCCTGEQLATVFIAMLDPEDMIWILTGVNVTGYEFNGDKSPSTKYVNIPATIDASHTVESYSNTWGDSATNNFRRLETVSLLYTAIRVEFANGGYRGWDTGSNTSVTEPPPTS